MVKYKVEIRLKKEKPPKHKYSVTLGRKSVEKVGLIKKIGTPAVSKDDVGGKLRFRQTFGFGNLSVIFLCGFSLVGLLFNLPFYCCGFLFVFLLEHYIDCILFLVCLMAFRRFCDLVVVSFLRSLYKYQILDETAHLAFVMSRLNVGNKVA